MGSPLAQRDSFTLKALYFTIWATVGTFWPFLSVHYRALGLSGTEVGLVAAAGALSGAVAGPVWATLNDRLGRTRMLLTISCAGAAVMVVLLSQLHTFHSILPGQACFVVFTSAILPLLDGTTLQMLGSHGAAYGSYRFWGTAGFIVTSGIAGFVYEHTGLVISFFAYGAGIVVFWCLTRRLADQRLRTGILSTSGLGVMARRPQWLLFMASVLFLWLAVMGGLNFLAIFIREMGGTDRSVGLAATIAAITEIPFLLGGPRILRALGPVRLLGLGGLVYAVRMLLYAVMPAYSWVLWINLLQGPSYGPFLIGSVAYANDLAPAGMQATAQSLLATIMSLANLGGGVLGGTLFDRVGRTGMYIVIGGLCVTSMLFFAAGLHWQGRAPRVPRPVANETLRIGGEPPG